MEFIIHTGYNGHQDTKLLEIRHGDEYVRIPFESLDKFPMNNSPVFRVGVKLDITPAVLKKLIEKLAP